MASKHRSRGSDGPQIGFPPGLADILRPELASLADEIVAEVARGVPEYRAGAEIALRRPLEEALNAFVDQIDDPAAPHDRLREICRMLGEHEASANRSLDALQAAYRVGVHVAWRRTMRIGQRENIPSTVMSLLADALFGYIDELATYSLEGYRAASTPPAEEREERRRRLLALILEGPAASRGALVEQGELAGWNVPDDVTPVAVETGPKRLGALLDDDVLVDLGAVQPVLLLPGPADAGRLAMLGTALAGRRAVAGIPVPPARAAASLRWARQVLELVRGGAIGDGGDRVTLCEDHLVDLWLLAGAELLDHLARRRFAALSTYNRAQRDRLIETLEAWLEKRGNAVEIADRLQVHPQTVRYRIRQLKAGFGDELDDPESRFALEVVLRAGRLRQALEREDSETPQAV